MNISSISLCFGCMACVSKCPKQCIKIKEGKLGHLYPEVTKDCIDCGLCLKICPSYNNQPFTSALHTWAVWRDDEELRSQSSSGGMASAISEYIISEGGIVYGCAFVPDFSFKHIRCSTIDDLQKLKGSKYVQSDIHEVYKSITNDLKSGLKVLFIGTPCQVSGIKMFFNKAQGNLFTIDLICHGVPSVKMLKESLPPKILHKNFGNISFRFNTKYHFSIKNDSSETIYERPLNKDLFLKSFFTALTYRESCHNCKFARGERISDVTLGDFWGLDVDVVKDVEKGVSLCFANTEKGYKLISEVTGITKIERPLSEAISGNKQLQKPMKANIRSKIFEFLYSKIGFKWSVILSIPEIIIKNKLVNLFK